MFKKGIIAFLICVTFLFTGCTEQEAQDGQNFIMAFVKVGNNFLKNINEVLVGLKGNESFKQSVEEGKENVKETFDTIKNIVTEESKENSESSNKKIE